jgi:hypothetical protein
VGRIQSVNLAVPEPNPAKGVGVTGINKWPVDHLVAVRAPGPKTTGLHSGLVGDQIFDIEHGTRTRRAPRRRPTSNLRRPFTGASPRTRPPATALVGRQRPKR